MTGAAVIRAVVSARRAGLRVIVLVDAYDTLGDCTERAALRQIERSGGEVTSVVTLATAVAPDFTTNVGRRMFDVLQKPPLA